MLKSINLSKTESVTPLIIKGQGVFLFSCPYNDICSLLFQDESKENQIVVEFTKKSLIVKRKKSAKSTKYSTLKNIREKKGLSKKPGATYWFSLDAQNFKLYAGIGEARLETVIYEYDFPNDEKSHKKTKAFLESLCEIQVPDTSQLDPLKLLRDPITTTIPLIIKDIDDLSMHDIASGKYLPKANLSICAQKLYHCIAGKKFTLDNPDFPDFTKAIEYSIATPGLWCYETLKRKNTEFNKNKPNLLETYLRITLGKNNGDSPGIPYVMEIWPVGHFSPVHNHGGSSAIIRVLNGSINVSLFPFLCEDKKGINPFLNTNVNNGEITWISPTLNQVHQLKNLEQNTDTCITIQCYIYENDNTTHYDYFDYVAASGNIKQFEPDSDMDFIEFREIVKKEWESKP
jgi:hypothetical protein